MTQPLQLGTWKQVAQDRSTRLFWLLCATLLWANLATAEVRSVADIESVLAPLEFLDNHGGVRRALDLDIAFAFDSAEILPRGLEQIAALGNAMGGPRLVAHQFHVVGHTDAVGNPDYNQRLSEQRAAAVVAILIAECGIDAERLIAQGQGSNELKPGLAPDAAAQRRVEIIVANPSPPVTVDQQPASDDGVIKITW